MGVTIRQWKVERYHLGLSTQLQRFGPYDPSFRWSPRQLARAFWTPLGPCTLALRQRGNVIESEAVGDGAAWAESFLERMFVFTPQELPKDCAHTGLRALARELCGLKVGPMPWPFEVLVATIFQQRVTFEEAARSYTRLLNRYGTAAPGPLSLVLPLTREQWTQVGFNRLQEAGVDPNRARTILGLRALEWEFAPTGLERLSGLGPWTIQSVRGLAFGDPDAVPPGDVHLPRVVGQFLGPGRRCDDARMLELLEPFRGLRFRVIQWLMAGGRHRAFG